MRLEVILKSLFIKRSARVAAAFFFVSPTLHAADTVTVTATRTPVRVSDVVAEVTTLDRAALDRAEGRTLVELLSQQAGMQFTSTGGLGKTSGLFIRGLEARHTLLLIDGVPVGSATVGTPSLDNLPLEAIDRIEIVRGPMSSLYGNAAMGGVIQIFLRRGAPGLQVNGKASVGSQHFGQLAGGVSFGQGAFDAAVQVQHTETQSFSSTNTKVPFGSFNADRDGWRQNGGSLRLGWQATPDWRLEALALQSTGITGYDDGPGVAARAGLDNGLWLLSARGSVMPGWTTRLSLSRSLDAYDTLSSASAFASLGTIQTVQKLLAWENTVATPVGSLLVLAERLRQVVSRPGAPFSVSDRDIDGLALGLSGTGGAHSWQGSLRHDRNSQFGSKDTGAIGYGFALAPAWRVGASYGTSFVAPSFNQLYFPNFGSPNLQPEEGKHAEVSLRFAAGDHSLRAAYYEHRYRGFISSGPQPVNLPRVDIDGTTVSYEGRFQDLALSASIDHTDPRNATVGNANVGKLLPRRAKDALRAGADWQAGAFKLGGTLAAFSERFDNAANTARLGGYATLDLRAEWAWATEWALGIKLNNLGGKVYETALGYNQPGREAFVTLRYAGRP